MKETIIEKWEKTGILTNTPEERKEFVAGILDLIANYLINIKISSDSIRRESDGKTLKKEDLEIVQQLLIPIVARIANVVDISIDDIKNIYTNIEFGFFDFLEESRELSVINNLDLEAMYCSQIAEKYINSVKKVK